MASGTLPKDFLYLDVERLYSLYSQVFEGVVKEIIHSYENSLARANTEPGPVLSGNKLEAQVAELSRRTENRFLYDDMYSRFEEKVRDGVQDASKLPAQNVRQLLKSAQLMQVSGPAEIEDYARMKSFLDKFNEIGEAIAYSSTANDAAKEMIESASLQAEQIRDRNQRAKAREKVKSLSSAKSIAKQMGLHQDPELLKMLRMFVDLFYPDGFQISILPQESPEKLAFRAVIDKRWLRITPDMLRMLYGTHTEEDWTLVGYVTHYPGGGPSAKPVEGDPAETGTPSLRDPFRKVFQATREFERIFF